MSNIRNNIAKNIATFRKKSGLTQKELAEMVGVKNTTVSVWESGSSAPDAETIFALADIFGVSISDIYGQDANKEVPLSQRIARAYDRADLPVKRTVEVALEPYMEDKAPQGD